MNSRMCCLVSAPNTVLTVLTTQYLIKLHTQVLKEKDITAHSYLTKFCHIVCVFFCLFGFFCEAPFGKALSTNHQAGAKCRPSFNNPVLTLILGSSFNKGKDTHLGCWVDYTEG